MKNYEVLTLSSYLIKVVGALIFYFGILQFTITQDQGCFLPYTLGALAVYTIGGLIELLIDMAKSTSIQAEIMKREYKATLEERHSYVEARSPIKLSAKC